MAKKVALVPVVVPVVAAVVATAPLWLPPLAIRHNIKKRRRRRRLAAAREQRREMPSFDDFDDEDWVALRRRAVDGPSSLNWVDELDQIDEETREWHPARDAGIPGGGEGGGSRPGTPRPAGGGAAFQAPLRRRRIGLPVSAATIEARRLAEQIRAIDEACAAADAADARAAHAERVRTAGIVDSDEEEDEEEAAWRAQYHLFADWESVHLECDDM